ncbi:heat-labile enterotoxin alpha chain domain-containing protein [Hirsutella rhossiliensis]|uniref:Heat-labile enterotoxin alpha chain domain-containing protein n=1 Tax=Hirsutella rhossiliensis TaxID=111463 RepID=A0A9P8N4S4_9HYPO|nr:heat-labile enterotoxin alpha chain domain-containing protein [Hirsutella rhossiliensis]KAH0966915.1 heat-labile enterotoxin alpha chain domain-containing protein [Hirsutella rhossiliensis]
MKGLWLPTLWALLVLVLGFGQSLPSAEVIHSMGKRGVAVSKPAPDPEQPTTVWRGEKFRTPQEVEAAGGMFSRGLEKQRRGETLTKEEIGSGSSLYEHAKGNRIANSQYVSTASDPALGLRFGRGGDQNGESNGYLYRIHADTKAIDVDASLGRYSPYKGQTENAFIGGIPFDQIEGWYELKGIKDTDVLETIKRGESPGRVEFIKNPKFNEEKYRNQKGSGAQPQIAGFPETSDAWKEKPWNQYKDQKVLDNLGNFYWNKVCGGTSCNKDFQPLVSQPLPEPDAGKDGSSGPNENGEPLCKRSNGCRNGAEPANNNQEANKNNGEKTTGPPADNKPPANNKPQPQPDINQQGNTGKPGPEPDSELVKNPSARQRERRAEGWDVLSSDGPREPTDLGTGSSALAPAGEGGLSIIQTGIKLNALRNVSALRNEERVTKGFALP